MHCRARPCLLLMLCIGALSVERALAQTAGFSLREQRQIPLQASLDPNMPHARQTSDDPSSYVIDFDAEHAAVAGMPAEPDLIDLILGAQDSDIPRYGLYGFHGYSSWRGNSEGSGENNNGFLYGVNSGLRLGNFGQRTGIGAQIGGSYGFYDLNGRASGFGDNQIQQQAFITTGLFRKADYFTRASAGVCFDAMFNTNFGQFAASPFLSQLRAQIGYWLTDNHEVGFWTALRTSSATQDILGPLKFRGVDQFNLFWHHKFAFGGDGWSWIGIPDQSKLGGDGTIGKYIFGGTLSAPLSPRFGVYTDLLYMPPSAHRSPTGAREEYFYVGLGIMFFPGRNMRSYYVRGDAWMPYMPVANNGSFMVDTNRSF